MNDAAFYIINFIIGCVLTLIIFCQVLYFDMFSFTCLFNPIILTLLFIAAMISFTFFVSIFFEKGNLFVPLFFDFFFNLNFFYKFPVIYSANGGFLFYIVLPVFFSFYSENKTLQLFKFIDPFSCFSEGFKILLRFRDTGEFLKPSLSFSSGIYNFFLLQVVTLNLRIGFLMVIQ